MIPYNPEDEFVCEDCGRSMKVYYQSIYNTEICVHCDTSSDYDEDYYEDDSDSPYNE